MVPSLPFQLFINPRRGAPGIVVLPSGGFRRARADIMGWPGYAPTPLRALPALAQQAGVAALHVKDEAGRFGFGGFEALGAYAVARAISAELARRETALAATSAELFAGQYAEAAVALVVTCASDGGHGRSVAWGAQRFGAGCAVFVPGGADPACGNVGHGAAVHLTQGTFDDAMRAASAAAGQPGWLEVSDTARPGSSEAPRDVMQGYRLMAEEALDQWPGTPPTHVFIQGLGGAVAAAVSVAVRTRLESAPALVIVEPDGAAPLASAAGAPCRAGRAPSLIAWQELDRAAAAFMTLPETAHATASLTQAGIPSGQAGALGFGALWCVAHDAAARASLALGADSRVLVFNTEGPSVSGPGRA